MIELSHTEYTFKICIFGDGGVGKTTLTQRYLTGKFDANISITLGANILVKFLKIKDMKISLQIWDFGGEEMFRFLLPSYAVGSSGGIFMFDLTRNLSLINIETWVNTFRKNLNPPNVPLYFVGSKIDLKEQRSVAREDAIILLKKYDLSDYFECSAMTGENVEEIFTQLASLMLKNVGVL